MSLPSSEPLPDDINDLSPARQRHLRRMPRAASPAEREILLESLLQLTGPGLDYFLLALLGPVSAGAAFAFNEPVLLVLSIIAFPFNSPIFSLALVPPTQKLGQGLKSLLSLLIGVVLAFGAGMATGWLAPAAAHSRLAIIHFSAPYWLNIALVAGSALFCCFVLLREARLPRLAGALLSYEIMLPLVAAGYGLITGHAQLWPGALLTGLAHLGLALVLAVFTFALLGFPPKPPLGWLLALIPLALTLALLTAALFYAAQTNPAPPEPPAQEVMPQPTWTASTEAGVAATQTPTTLSATATLEPTPSLTASPLPKLTATPTLTPEPTGYPGVVTAEEGAIIRQSPDFGAPIVTYVYDGDLILVLGEITENNTRWLHIETETGETGWLLGSLVNTPTPAPTATTTGG